MAVGDSDDRAVDHAPGGNAGSATAPEYGGGAIEVGNGVEG
jgi:hypothetical protein